MTDDVHPQHSDITDEMWKQVDAIIAANRDVPGSVPDHRLGLLRERVRDGVGLGRRRLVEVL